MFYRFRQKQLHLDVLFPQKYSGVVLVYLSGFPTLPKESIFTKACQKNGITVIMPHYYGSWLSGGKFIPQNLIKTVKDTILFASKGKSTEQYNLEEKKWKVSSIILGGGSFGALIALKAAQDLNIKKIILSAPLIDVSNQGKMRNEENLLHSLDFSRRVFKNVYRGVESKSWDNFFSGNLEFRLMFDKLKQKNILIIHGDSDTTINIEHSKKFVKLYPNCELKILKGITHRIWEEISYKELKEIIDWLLKSQQSS